MLRDGFTSRADIHAHLSFVSSVKEGAASPCAMAFEASSSIMTTEIARKAIMEFLEKRRKDALYSAINDYAKRHAGTRLDLDEELEAVARGHLGTAQEEAE